MALLNNDLSQTSQAQAATPIHRDSVVSLALTQASSAPSYPMAHRQVMSAYTATLPRSAHPQIDGGNEGLPYNDWMSQFCVEPRGDIGCVLPKPIRQRSHPRTTFYTGTNFAIKYLLLRSLGTVRLIWKDPLASKTDNSRQGRIRLELEGQGRL